MIDTSSNRPGNTAQQLGVHRAFGGQVQLDMRDWKLADFVYERIFGMIVNGDFPENSRLPSETKLCEMLGVSRPILRRALARLREDDLIHSRQGSGSFVKRQPNPAVLNFAPVGSIADIQRCFEFREAVECEAARLAATRRTSEQLARIEAALKQMDEAGDLPVLGDERFHLAISEATENFFFVSALSSMQTQIRVGMNLARDLSLLRPFERLALVQAEHIEIAEAIRIQDPVRAEKAMRVHLQNARVRVFEGEIA